MERRVHDQPGQFSLDHPQQASPLSSHGHDPIAPHRLRVRCKNRASFVEESVLIVRERRRVYSVRG